MNTDEDKIMRGKDHLGCEDGSSDLTGENAKNAKRKGDGE
jgi:hypothetical protein